MTDPSRRLADCPLVIFIAYTLPADAGERGYAPWLERVDNPFFNSRPGVRHYANWRLGRVLSGTAPGWDWFDFEGLASAEDLESVWFDPALDDFRAEWIRLWGYGPRDARTASVLANSYVLRPAAPAGQVAAAERAVFVAGCGEAPAGGAIFQVTGVLPKHFAAPAGTPRPDDWCRPVADGNPLGFDWLGLVADIDAVPAAATVVAEAVRVAAPDRAVQKGESA